MLIKNMLNIFRLTPRRIEMKFITSKDNKKKSNRKQSNKKVK